MKMKKGALIAIVAAGAAVVGGLVALAFYLRAKARDLSERLDFDGDLYDEEDSLFDVPFDDDASTEIEEDDIDSLPIADDISDADFDEDQND